MYSVVLMGALMAGGTTTNWHPCAACGHHGGYGAGCPGFCGGGYGSCGCWGGYSNWSYCNMPPPNPSVMGGYGLGGGSVGAGTGTSVPGTGNGQEEIEKPKKSKPGVQGRMIHPSRAQLLIEVPANAKLFIDDKPVKTALGVQTFDIPALEPDQVYFYMVRIEMMRDGQPISETRRILVRAGQVARAEFKELEPETPRTAWAK